MFDQWKQAWREAVENFWREIDRERVTGPSAERTAAMRRDVTAARAELDRVEADLLRARSQLREERAAEQSCRRRERLALDIHDAETARVAAEYAARHGEHAAVLERKAQALDAELELRRRDVDEMADALRIAEAAAGTGGGTSGDPGIGHSSPDDDVRDRTFRRMEQQEREREAERRLEELKRRMR